MCPKVIHFKPKYAKKPQPNSSGVSAKLEKLKNIWDKFKKKFRVDPKSREYTEEEQIMALKIFQECSSEITTDPIYDYTTTCLIALFEFKPNLSIMRSIYNKLSNVESNEKYKILQKAIAILKKTENRRQIRKQINSIEIK